MSYGAPTSERISSDSTDAFEITVNNNADIFNILAKPLDTFTSGYVTIEVLNTFNNIYEPVINQDGKTTKIYMSSPRAVRLQHVSLNKVRFTPAEMDAGKSYQMIVENLSSWSDG